MPGPTPSGHRRSPVLPPRPQGLARQPARVLVTIGSGPTRGAPRACLALALARQRHPQRPRWTRPAHRQVLGHRPAQARAVRVQDRQWCRKRHPRGPMARRASGWAPRALGCSLGVRRAGLAKGRCGRNGRCGRRPGLPCGMGGKGALKIRFKRSTAKHFLALKNLFSLGAAVKPVFLFRDWRSGQTWASQAEPDTAQALRSTP